MVSKPAETGRIKHLNERLNAHTAPDVLAHLARAVLGSDDPHISHAAVLAQLPSYIADEMAGLPVSELYPDVKRHFDLCTDCEAEYLDLLSLAQMEMARELSAPAGVPHPDLSFLPQKITLPGYVRALTKELVTALQPEALPDFQVIADAFFRWIERQGGRLILVRADLGEALDVSEGELPDSALILAATQLTTQALVDSLAIEDIQAWIEGNRLQPFALEHAKGSAQKVGFDADAAREFAQQYAEQITLDVDMLRELVVSQSS